MAYLSSHLLRLDDVVLAHGDGYQLEDAHVFTSHWFQKVNHLSGIILMNINNTRNVISNSDKWGKTFNKLIDDFIRITPHAEEYLNTEQLSVYMEISDPERTQASYNDGGLCAAPCDIQRVELLSTAPYTHQGTYRAYPNEASF